VADVPAGLLHRIVGPEPGMPYPREARDWAARLHAIAESIRDGWDAPPVIAGYQGGDLIVNDGNTGTPPCSGCGTVETVLHFDDEHAWQAFRPAWAGPAAREAGVPR
jgi:hypothetical protein